MTTYIALLRAMNLAGKTQVAMSDLRDLLVSLGFGDVRSLRQSGDLIRYNAQPTTKLEQLLERETEKRLALRTAFFVRHAKEWQAAFNANPFP